MSLTIGKRVPKHKAGRDFVTRCAECMAADFRSKLKKFADGQLRHPRCHRGPTAQELAQLNAERARGSRRTYPPIDGPGPKR